MEISDAIIAMVGAIAGGSITGYYTLKATDKAIRDQNEKERRRDEREVRNLLDALGVEISTLWEFHMHRVGQMLEDLPTGKALEFYYPLTQDYFTIYNSNAALIGRIPNADLRKAIVVCYNKCKKVVDGFKYNNELFCGHHDLTTMSGESLDSKRIDAKFKELVDYAKVLKEDHFELKSYVDRLMELITACD